MVLNHVFQTFLHILRSFDYCDDQISFFYQLFSSVTSRTAAVLSFLKQAAQFFFYKITSETQLLYHMRPAAYPIAPFPFKTLCLSRLSIYNLYVEKATMIKNKKERYSMKDILFKGVGTAMITPMKEDGSINYEVFKDLLEMQIRENADAVVVAGTTGEGSTLSDEEHIELVRYAAKCVNGRIPVIAGAGSNNTAHAVFLSKECEAAGADGLLHVTPYYNKASQQGLFLHFSECAKATKLPIILYNVPSRTGVNIFPATYKRLSEIPNIVAAKEASGNFSQMAKIASLCKDDLAIYSGNDDQITSALAIGAKGVISVIGNIIPQDTHNICASYFAGNSEESDNIQLKYLELIEALFLDVNPIPVKQAMRAMGYQAGPCRLPLCDMDSTMAEKLYTVLRQYGLLKKNMRSGSVTVHRVRNLGTIPARNL